MNAKGKGNKFERDICKQLSLWWTNGENDAVFWRTASSGGRATQRGKKGKSTKNQHSDITANDPIGQSFVDLFVIECKKGYNKDSFADLFDCLSGSTPKYLKWIEGLRKSCKNSDSHYWLLIVKRDRRDTMCCFSERLCFGLAESGSEFDPFLDCVNYTIKINNGDENTETLVFMRLADFLDSIAPDDIVNLLKLKHKDGIHDTFAKNP